MKTTRSTNRRNFLLAAGLGGAGVAGALVAGGRKSAAKAGLADAASQPSGYHASEHILKYYKTAKV
ncbi:MAG: formate dehydrogenase [Usitatibacter sp.]